MGDSTSDSYNSNSNIAIRGNSLYSIVSASNWELANQKSIELGGYLVTINSAEEDDFVWNNFKFQDLSADGYDWGYWIGLRRDPGSDPQSRDSWFWASGENVSYFNSTFNPGEPGSEPNGGGSDLYTHIWGFNEGIHEVPSWDDTTNIGNPGSNSFSTVGIAEIPLNIFISISDTPTEGAGVFSASINLTSGNETSGNLAEGTQVYWEVNGITEDDLATGELNGSGIIVDGTLNIEQSLRADLDEGENYELSVYSDAELTQQIGDTFFSAINENEQQFKTVIRGNSLYSIVSASNWELANQKSIELGGYLVTINSAEEDDFVWNNFKFQDLSADGYDWGYWIGLRRDPGSDPQSRDSWFWASGENVSYFNSTFNPGEPGSEPNGGGSDLYTHIWGFNEGIHEVPSWDDTTNIGNPGSNSFSTVGIAEIPLNIFISISDTPTEGAGVFSASINLTSGNETSGNLAEGTQVYWEVNGITEDDLATGELNGSGIIVDGTLNIEQSLRADLDEGENYELSVYSDAELTQQIGDTFSTVIKESGPITVKASQSTTLKPIEDNLILEGSLAINGTGNSRNNLIVGNSANNILDGKAGKDILKGKDGDDIYIVDNKKDKAIERAQQGNDTIQSSVSTKTRANIENLLLTGSKALKGAGNDQNNILEGNAGNNQLKGKAGNDTLIGNSGKDNLSGGADDDTFVYRSTADSGTTKRTRDKITDFQTGDTIDLSQIDANATVLGDQAFTFIGSDNFSAAGQVRFNKGILSVNTDDDLNADLQVQLKGVSDLLVGSLVL